LDGRWLVAERQTAGRGRHGREWQSLTGNFHGSCVVELRASDPAAHSLALVAAIAVFDAIVDCTRGAVKPTIKWPNDLLIDGAKIAGILLERQGNIVVVGIGANLSWAPEVPGRKTTALKDMGHMISAHDFAHRLAGCFAQVVIAWRNEGLQAVLRQWQARAHPIGTMLTISEGLSAGLTGAFDGLEQDGSLRLRVGDGQIRIVHSGEVQLGDKGEGKQDHVARD
jgi:BirA family transcriptional regulator, biotin operon repressor / biotin---[acetyl-CoA-carboxylase] ligase